MKLNRIITLCAITAALALSVGDVFAQAQDNGGNNNNNGGQAGGQGGQRRNRQNGGGGGPGGGNFDPAAMQQRIMDNVKTELEFTNDTDWSAVQPLVQKVLDARRDVGTGSGMRALFGRNRGGNNNNGGGNNPGRGGFGGQPSPEQDALQKALDDNAPAS